MAFEGPLQASRQDDAVKLEEAIILDESSYLLYFIVVYKQTSISYEVHLLPSGSLSSTF